MSVERTIRPNGPGTHGRSEKRDKLKPIKKIKKGKMSREWAHAQTMPVSWDEIVETYLQNITVPDDYRRNELKVVDRSPEKKEHIVKFSSVVNPRRIPSWLVAFLSTIGFNCQIATNTSVLICSADGQMLSVTQNQTGHPYVKVNDRTCFQKGRDGTTEIQYKLSIDCTGLPGPLQNKASEFLLEAMKEYRKQALAKLIPVPRYVQ